MHYKSQIELHSRGNPTQFFSISTGVLQHFVHLSPRKLRNSRFHPAGFQQISRESRDRHPRTGLHFLHLRGIVGSSPKNLETTISIIHCVSKKVPTFLLSVTSSNINRFSHFLHCWKLYENCYKTHMASPTSP